MRVDWDEQKTEYITIHRSIKPSVASFKIIEPKKTKGFCNNPCHSFLKWSFSTIWNLEGS